MEYYLIDGNSIAANGNGATSYHIETLSPLTLSNSVAPFSQYSMLVTCLGAMLIPIILLQLLAPLISLIGYASPVHNYILY